MLFRNYTFGCLCFIREITLDQFKLLLKDVAPKYKKDAKLASDEEAVSAMEQKICERGPSTSGTTVCNKCG